MYKYKRIKLKNGKTNDEHRILWEKEYGPIKKGYELHHINGDGKDNHLENLLLVTRSEHMIIHLAKGKVCSVEGCGKPYFSKGFCKMHYNKDVYQKDKQSGYYIRNREHINKVRNIRRNRNKNAK
jgi:hypothetical protein